VEGVRWVGGEGEERRECQHCVCVQWPQCLSNLLPLAATQGLKLTQPHILLMSRGIL
jgi:hypothetical protein